MATNGILLGQNLDNSQNIDLNNVEIIPANIGEGRCYPVDGYVNYGDVTIKPIIPLYSGTITIAWYTGTSFTNIIQIKKITAGSSFTPSVNTSDRNAYYYAYIFYNIVPKFSLI